jgi:hypothetical protein
MGTGATHSLPRCLLHGVKERTPITQWLKFQWEQDHDTLLTDEEAEEIRQELQRANAQIDKQDD